MDWLQPIRGAWVSGVSLTSARGAQNNTGEIQEGMLDDGGRGPYLFLWIRKRKRVI